MLLHVKSFHIYRDGKNDHYIFDQIGSELSKMDQNGILPD